MKSNCYQAQLLPNKDDKNTHAVQSICVAGPVGVGKFQVGNDLVIEAVISATLTH